MASIFANLSKLFQVESEAVETAGETERVRRMGCEDFRERAVPLASLLPSGHFSEGDETAAIIGAGISGLCTASVFRNRGINPVILEKSEQPGGIWRTLANHSSRAQIDCVAYRPLESGHATYSNYTPTQDLLDNFDIHTQHHGLEKQLLFGACVESFVSDGDHCYLSFVKNNETIIARCDGVYLCTGDLGSIRRIHYPGEETFQGTIAYGVANDLDPESFRDQDVVIVGMGAFAVENARTAIEHGARHVTIVARRYRLVLSRYTSYLTARLALDLKRVKPKEMLQKWTIIEQAHRSLLEATDTLHLLEDATIRVRGALHYKLRGTNATSDIFYLMHHYGVLECKRDEIARVGPDFVETKQGQTIRADIILKCIGSTANEGLLEDRMLLHGRYVDSQHNMGAFFGWDRCLKPHMLYGPHAEQTTLNPFSIIHLVEQIAEIDAYFLKHPEAFRKFTQKAKKGHNPPVYAPEVVDLDSNFTFFNYCLADGPVELIKRLFAYTSARERMYERHLSAPDFLAQNEADWNKWCDVLSERTGKSPLPYPFAGHEVG